MSLCRLEASTYTDDANVSVLFINILMDGPPSQSLGVDPVNREVMRKPPRRKDAPVLSKRLLIRVLFSASMIILGTLFVYAHELSDGKVSRRDQTMVSSSSPSPCLSSDRAASPSRPSPASSSSILPRPFRTVAYRAALRKTECSSSPCRFPSASSFSSSTSRRYKVFSRQRA